MESRKRGFAYFSLLIVNYKTPFNSNELKQSVIDVQADADKLIKETLSNQGLVLNLEDGLSLYCFFTRTTGDPGLFADYLLRLLNNKLPDNKFLATAIIKSKLFSLGQEISLDNLQEELLTFINES